MLMEDHLGLQLKMYLSQSLFPKKPAEMKVNAKDEGKYKYWMRGPQITRFEHFRRVLGCFLLVYSPTGNKI